MKVLRAESAGYCMGVSLALRRLDDAIVEHAARPAGRLATLGPIIHNPLVTDKYAARGVICLSDAADAQADDRVIIRAHGISREAAHVLAKIGAQVIDATCPKVKLAQMAIAEQRRIGGGTLLLFGEADHPEVRGLISYAANDALVFGNSEELAALPLNPDGNYYLAAQTTQDNLAFSHVALLLTKHFGHELPVLHTICNATRKRQDETIALARQVDIMVVVGGANSGNTRRLAEVAASQGIAAMLVEKPQDVNLAELAGKCIVGLTAGASTPVEHIDEVQAMLEKLPGGPAAKTGTG